MAKNDNEKTIGMTVKKEDDMPAWFEELCLKSEIAEFSDVKGCMVIRPHGYAIWESIQEYFNKVIKANGVQNAAFPLMIPESYFKKEAEHAEGFSPEVAWVTHAGDTKLDEKLAIRPTSETLISKSFKRWLRSYRDLPIKVNQWCSVVRWETKQTKLFLRSREFWWQEGHCIYETEEECVKETEFYLESYKRMCEELLAVPVLAGVKTKKEKFAGAVDTYAIEALMPDGKALQMGTSHYLGQGFMKAFDVKFRGRDEKMHIPHYNSWGVSTRLMGALFMTHSDNKGLVLPPKIAPIQVVIIPILFEKTKKEVIKACKELKQKLAVKYKVHLDDRDEYKPGWKYNEWEMKGVPVRIEIGPKDLEKDEAVIARRDTGDKAKSKLSEVPKEILSTFEKMEMDMFNKAKKFLKDSIVETNDWKEFMEAIKSKKMVKSYFCNEPECEDWIKDKAGGATSRCIPLGSKNPPSEAECVHCGKPAKVEIYFSKSY